jgi:hypothetical protein
MPVNEATIAAGIFLLGIAFGCGVYAMTLRITTKHINGLGARLNRVVAAVVHITPADEREKVILTILGLQSTPAGHLDPLAKKDLEISR